MKWNVHAHKLSEEEMGDFTGHCYLQVRGVAPLSCL